MIILRHCESEFNRLYTQTGRDPNLADPALSAAGQTLVVSHWWFLLGLCGDSLENGEWRHYPL
ncbi:MAG: hypothetical protein ABF611_06005 [Acetobacter orientalis]|uniref:hypothetical protein n=1 Tax=Acetobacter orientalis TaxID=146474 RepID=UPI0039E85ECA